MVVALVVDKAIGALGKLNESIQGAIRVADRFQQQTQGLGLSFEGAVKNFNAGIDDLRGGFVDRLVVNLTTLNAGFQGNAKGVAKLINQQQLTNGAFQKTAQALAQLEAGLGMSREATDALAENIIISGREYTIATSKLVDTIGALEKNMAPLRQAGLGDIPSSMMRAAASFGPQLQKDFKTFLGFVFDPSMELLSKKAVANLDGFVESLGSANEQERIKLVFDAIRKSGRQIEMLAGGADKFYSSADLPRQLIGSQTDAIYNLYKNIGEREQQSIENMALFGETIRNMRQELFVPFKAYVTEKVVPALTEMVSKITTFLKPIVNDMGKSALDRLIKFATTFKVDTFLSGVKDFLLNAAKGLDAFFQGPYQTIIKIFDFARKGFAHFYNASLLLTDVMLKIANFMRDPVGNSASAFADEMRHMFFQAVSPRGFYVTPTRGDFPREEYNNPLMVDPETFGREAMNALISGPESPNYFFTLMSRSLDSIEEMDAARNRELEGIHHEVRDQPEAVAAILDESITTLGDVVTQLALGGQGQDATRQDIVDTLRTLGVGGQGVSNDMRINNGIGG